jgi:glycosyltransferase involved in cell wall biosynthesis
MAGREKFLKKAIQCFFDQDYAGNAELIILPDGPCQVTHPNGHLARDGSLITVLTHTGAHANVGEKRNAGCKAAQGEIIVHFDDDDWSAPGRISDQVKQLQESGKPVTGYSTILVRETRTVLRLDETLAEHATSGWWRLTIPGGEAAGTSFCYRRDWWEAHPFPPVNTCEDNAFWREAAGLDAAIAVDGRDLVCATNHVGNISARMVCGPAWTELPGSPYPVFKFSSRSRRVKGNSGA